MVRSPFLLIAMISNVVCVEISSNPLCFLKLVLFDQFYNLIKGHSKVLFYENKSTRKTDTTDSV